MPPGTVRVDVSAIAIGDVALGLKAGNQCAHRGAVAGGIPYEHTLIVSMVNGGQKYMPHREAYDNFTWEAQSSMLMPGAAEAWVEGR